MSYTPPVGNVVHFDFTVSYTPPVGNVVHFKFGAMQVELSTIQIIGLTPTLTIVSPFSGVVEQGVINLIGFTPIYGRFIGQALHGVIIFYGLTPAFKTNFLGIAGQLAVLITGLTPDYQPAVYAFAQNLGLQFQHAFNAILISPDDITYQLILDNGVSQLAIPMQSFSLRRAFDAFSATPTDSMTVTCPAAFYEQAAGFTGATAKLYKRAKNLSRILTSQTLSSVSSNGLTSILKTTALGSTGVEQMELTGAMYVRVINSKLAIRLPPNFDVRRGAHVTVDGQTLDVSSVVIYVSSNQQFMEIS